MNCIVCHEVPRLEFDLGRRWISRGGKAAWQGPDLRCVMKWTNQRPPRGGRSKDHLQKIIELNHVAPRHAATCRNKSTTFWCAIYSVHHNGKFNGPENPGKREVVADDLHLRRCLTSAAAPPPRSDHAALVAARNRSTSLRKVSTWSLIRCDALLTRAAISPVSAAAW
ncbi:MAG: hypothetical protein ACLP8B_04310, partial [Xanthobacteraceae bacterium]